MFYVLTSLEQLLIGWASSDFGRSRLASIPRNPALDAEFARLRQIGERLTGSTPSSDAIAQTTIAFLS